MSGNYVIPVNNFLMFKSIKDNPDEEGGLLFIGTCIQTINNTSRLDPEKEGFEDKNGNFFFPYRINEEVADESNGFMKVRKVEVNKNISRTTFAVRAPLEIESVFDDFPFKLKKASITIELDRLHDKDHKKVFHPEFYLNMEHKCANVAIQPPLRLSCANPGDHSRGLLLKVARLLHPLGGTSTQKIMEKMDRTIQYDLMTQKIMDKMDRTIKYDFITPYPEICYVTKRSVCSKVEISFHLVEFGTEKFLPVVLPLFLIFFLNLINVSFNSTTDSLDYLANSATLALAMVFLVGNINNGLFTTSIFISLMLCSIPEEFLVNNTTTSKVLAFFFGKNDRLPAQMGCWIFGLSFFVPLINFINFYRKCRAIKYCCPPMEDFIDMEKEAKPFKVFTGKFEEYFSPIASLISEHKQLQLTKGYVIEDTDHEQRKHIHYSRNNWKASESDFFPGEASESDFSPV